MNDLALDVSVLLRLGHPNVLIVGSGLLADAVLDRLRPCLPPPLYTCDLPGRLTLPADGGTLLLREVAALDAAQQDELLRWLDRNGGQTQVVSVSSMPLFWAVERGEFDHRLYYRLNTILEEVDLKFAAPPQ